MWFFNKRKKRKEEERKARHENWKRHRRFEAKKRKRLHKLAQERVEVTRSGKRRREKKEQHHTYWSNSNKLYVKDVYEASSIEKLKYEAYKDGFVKLVGLESYDYNYHHPSTWEYIDTYKMYKAYPVVERSSYSYS